eukprot:TRINITY_DN3205_c0_g2_i1.p1 TRINITY_DN3205_c0_g2~~TRINITY_DN3205_c0_g2_i1.p1  ORF type:complete len:267 (+),score=47.93 TRINITY_DN3205_c0_g2_i1:149-949(+)
MEKEVSMEGRKRELDSTFNDFVMERTDDGGNFRLNEPDIKVLKELMHPHVSEVETNVWLAMTEDSHITTAIMNNKEFQYYLKHSCNNPKLLKSDFPALLENYQREALDDGLSSGSHSTSTEGSHPGAPTPAINIAAGPGRPSAREAYYLDGGSESDEDGGFSRTTYLDSDDDYEAPRPRRACPNCGSVARKRSYSTSSFGSGSPPQSNFQKDFEFEFLKSKVALSIAVLSMFINGNCIVRCSGAWKPVKELFDKFIPMFISDARRS